MTIWSDANTPRLGRNLRSFEEFKAELLRIAPVLTDFKWDDQNESDLGVALINLMALCSEALDKRIDDNTLLMYLNTCFDRTAILQHAALSGFKMECHVASSTGLTFSVDKPAPSTIHIPRGSMFQTGAQATTTVETIQVGGKELVFSTTQDTYVLKGQTSSLSFVAETSGIEVVAANQFYVQGGGNKTLVYQKAIPLQIVWMDLSQTTANVVDSSWDPDLGMTLVEIDRSILVVSKNANIAQLLYGTDSTPAIQGIGRSQSWLATGVDWFGLTLDDPFVAHKSWTVFVGEEEFFPVDNLALALSTDKVYTWEVTANNQVQIMFGNGYQGVRPKNNQTITVTWVSTNGPQGNVAANTIVSQISTLWDADGNKAYVRCTNMTPSVGGRDPMTVERAQALMPISIKTNSRMVVLEDYAEQMRQLVPGLSRVKAVDIGTDRYSVPFRLVRFFAIPEGGGQVSSTMRASMLEAANQMGIVGNIVEVWPWEPFPIDLTIMVDLEYGVDSKVVQAQIEEKVSYYISDQCLNVGDPVFIVGPASSDPDQPSNVSQLLNDIYGIRSFSFSSYDEIRPAYNQMAVLRKLDIVIRTVS